MMSLREIRKQLFRGDIGVLFRLFGKEEKTIQPSEVAQIFLNLPASSAVKAFQSFPEKNRITIFPYLDTLLQKQVIQDLPNLTCSCSTVLFGLLVIYSMIVCHRRRNIP